MNDPDDKALLEFVARFAGWKFNKYTGNVSIVPAVWTHKANVPDYLHSVDAWLRDVWPKVREKRLSDKWLSAFFKYPSGERNDGSAEDMNADARSRCLALWRALEGKLP